MDKMQGKSKTLLLIIGIVVSLGLIAGVFFMVRRQTEVEPSPTPAPKPAESPKAEVPGVFIVDGEGNACTDVFEVQELVPGLGCSTKKAWKDSASNTAGNYTLTEEIGTSEALEPGDQFVYSIAYKNTGTAEVSGATITDVLPTQLDYVDGEEACTYTSSTRTVTCTIGAVAAGGEGTASFRVKVKTSATAGELNNTAEFEPTSGDASSCSVTNEIAVEEVVAETSLSCTKRAWKDEAGNKADQYTYITQLDGAKPGDTVVFELAYDSEGLSYTDVEDTLDANLQFIDSADECTYSSTSRKLTCRLDDLDTKPTGSVLFRARISDSATVGSTITNTGSFSNTDSDETTTCSKNLVVNESEVVSSPAGSPTPTPSTVAEASPVPSELPEAGIMTFTTGTVGIGILLVMLGLLGVLLI